MRFRRRAVANQDAQLVDVEHFAGLADEVGVEAQTGADKVVVHGANHQRHRDHGVGRVERGVGEVDLRAIADHLLDLIHDPVEGFGKCAIDGSISKTVLTSASFRPSTCRTACISCAARTTLRRCSNFACSGSSTRTLRRGPTKASIAKILRSRRGRSAGW